MNTYFNKLQGKEVHVMSGVLSKVFSNFEVVEGEEMLSFGESDSENYDFEIHKNEIYSYKYSRGLETLRLKSGITVSFIEF